LLSNHYWNGGEPIPTDSQETINYTDDAAAELASPLLPNPAAVTLPRWNPGSGLFADGSATIRQAFVGLVQLYAVPGSTSPALGSADPAHSPLEDILGNPRSPLEPDRGAYQSQLDPADYFAVYLPLIE
jgi:hypothetical protein